MSALRARAEEYLAMRRALGFRLESWGPRLMSFVRFCEERGTTTVTTDMAVEWATSTVRGSDHEAYHARRLDVVRIFARHLQPLDPAAEVPPEDVLDRRQWRIAPYLYSAQEVTALMTAARTLRPAFRAVTWRTLIGLQPRRIASLSAAVCGDALCLLLTSNGRQRNLEQPVRNEDRKRPRERPVRRLFDERGI